MFSFEGAISNLNLNNKDDADCNWKRAYNRKRSRLIRIPSAKRGNIFLKIRFFINLN